MEDTELCHTPATELAPAIRCGEPSSLEPAAALSAFASPASRRGQPAITVPGGFSHDGLPIGLQMIGPRHADARALRATAAYEQAALRTGRRPPVDSEEKP